MNSVKFFFNPNKKKLIKLNFKSENFLSDALLYVKFLQNFLMKIAGDISEDSCFGNVTSS